MKKISPIKLLLKCSIIFIIIGFSSCVTTSVISQEHEVKFLSRITNETDYKKLYDSLLVPLVIYNNNVYAIHSECFPRNAGGNVNSRNAGASVNDRNAGGN